MQLTIITSQYCNLGLEKNLELLKVIYCHHLLHSVVLFGQKWKALRPCHQNHSHAKNPQRNLQGPDRLRIMPGNPLVLNSSEAKSRKKGHCVAQALYKYQGPPCIVNNMLGGLLPRPSRFWSDVVNRIKHFCFSHTVSFSILSLLLGRLCPL